MTVLLLLPVCDHYHDYSYLLNSCYYHQFVIITIIVLITIITMICHYSVLASSRHCRTFGVAQEYEPSTNADGWPEAVYAFRTMDGDCWDLGI